METMNGYIVIAEKRIILSNGNMDDERIILGVRELRNSVNGIREFEYVTARARLRTENPTSWHAGMYTNSLGVALNSLDERAG